MERWMFNNESSLGILDEYQERLLDQMSCLNPNHSNYHDSLATLIYMYSLLPEGRNKLNDEITSYLGIINHQDFGGDQKKKEMVDDWVLDIIIRLSC